jgi:hypothetical protein
MKKIIIAVAAVVLILTVLYKANNYFICESVMEHMFQVRDQFPVKQYESEIDGIKELSEGYFAFEIHS